jgi:hypothetical protein
VPSEASVIVAMPAMLPEFAVSIVMVSAVLLLAPPASRVKLPAAVKPAAAVVSVPSRFSV